MSGTVDAKARGISPFAIEIDWRDESDNEYGFVVEKRVSEGKYARIGFANPNQTRFVEHGLVSGTRATYRVRAFNPRGESPASGEAAAETLSLDGWDAVAAALRNRQRPSPGPCLPQAYLEDVRKNLEEIAAKTGTGDEEGGEDQIEVRFNSVDLGNGHVVDAMIGTCGQGGCDCRLYGTYAGCYRELADFGVKVDADRPDIAFPTRSGWPILRSQMRAGLGMMDTRLLMMVNGRYVVVDSFGGCPDGGRYTEPEWLNDLTKSRPPFFDSDCQTR
ncbi:MAG: hypothetical protein DMD48_12875 [Gemmatimonadetes bacterium]|nr:MAG: hypothetical protein DMD48_12875 [Gemmatimonadota bacterium]